jgi:hypothetical protein
MDCFDPRKLGNSTLNGHLASGTGHAFNLKGLFLHIYPSYRGVVLFYAEKIKNTRLTL